MSVRERNRSRRSGSAAFTLALILACGAVLLVASSPAAAAAWKQPAFSASRSSFNPRETTIDAGNVASLVERWRVAGVFTKGSPVVANGRVFAANGDEMVALALDDGAELWRKSLRESDDCCGVYDPVLTPDGKVTAEVGWIGGGGTAVFDPATGAFTYDAAFHSGDVDRAVRGGAVFSIQFFYGSGGPLAYVLVPYGGLVYFGDFSSGPLSGLAVHAERAFVALGNGLRVFDLTSCPDPAPSPVGWCQPLWSADLSEQVLTPVAFRRSVAVAARDGSLQVHDAANGDLEWSAAVGAGIGHAPAVAKRRIFVPTERGVLVAFDSRGCGAATCTPVERFRLGSPATGQPVVAGDVLYAGTKDGRIVAFPAGGCAEPACDPLLDVDLGGGAIVAGPIVIDGTVIAGTADGQLVAYGLPTPG